MTHYGTKSRKARQTDDEWVTLNTQVGDVVNMWARRNDIVTYIGKDGGQGQAAAFYDPTTYEVEVNTVEAFGDHVEPYMVGDFTERDVQFEWAKASGLMMHEAMHARFSTVGLDIVAESIRGVLGLDQTNMLGIEKKLTKEEQKRVAAAHNAYQLLDESRIEGEGVRMLPKNRAFLRASALYLMNMDEATIAMQHPLTLGIRIAALGLARVDAGVLDKADVTKLRPLVNKVIEIGDRKTLRRIWREFQAQNDRRPSEYKRMIKLAVEWAELEAKLIEKWKEENGEDPESGEGEGGEGGEGLSDAMQELLDAMKDAMGQSAQITQMRAEAEAGEQQSAEEQERAQQDRAQGEQEQSENTGIASKMFDDSRGGTDATRGQTRTRRAYTREATDAERGTAIKVARAMEKAKYRDRIRTEKLSVLPPGRLRARATMQQAAARTQGRHIEVEAFKMVRHHHVEDPNLSLGMMCDISGSMGGAMEPMGAAAWIMSEAGRRIKATMAMTYFGNSVFPVLSPGQVQKEVAVYDATDGYEDFDTSFRALDGALKLLNGSGARILVIASDGQFKQEQPDRAVYWIKKARKAGVAVIWLAFKDAAWGIEELCNETGATPVFVGTNVTDAADAIAKACLDSLTSASA